MELSNDFKINVNKLNADEALLILLEITHPFLTEPVRLVNDNADIISNGENYIAMPFMIERQSDVQGELPKVTLTFPNVGRTFVRWIDSTGGGGADAVLSVMLLRRSSPDLIEERLNLGIANVKITTQTVVFNLIIQNNLVKKAINFNYDKKRSPGLF